VQIKTVIIMFSLLPLISSTAAFSAHKAVPFAGIEFIGEAFIPFKQQVKGTIVEGLSGLTRIGETNRYLAIADPTNKPPARFYELEINIDDGSLDKGDVTVIDVTLIQDQAGPLAGQFDLEGIALDPGYITLLIASEGVGKGATGAAPFIIRNSRFGQFINEIDIDLSKLDQTGGEGGVYVSGGFESLVYSADFAILWAANETALRQDGVRSSPGAGSPARLFKYDATNALQPTAVAEYVYMVEPRHGSMVNPGVFGAGGGRSLVDLLPLGDSGLLALEREYTDGEPQTTTRPVTLYFINTEKAENVISIAALQGDELAVTKSLVFDLDNLRKNGLVERVGSLEAMTFGPRLDDGRKTLLLLEDNNSASATQVIALAIVPKKCDVNFDSEINADDIYKIEHDTQQRIITLQSTGKHDARDANRDGLINGKDLRSCTRLVVDARLRIKQEVADSNGRAVVTGNPG